MSTSRRTFTREFKVAAINRLQTGMPVGRVVRELQVNANQLHSWKRQSKMKSAGKWRPPDPRFRYAIAIFHRLGQPP